MIFAKRIAVLLLTAVLLILYFRARTQNYHSTLQRLSQRVGLGDLVDDEEEDFQEQLNRQKGPFTNNNHVTHNSSESSYPTGTLKPAGEPYTRALVIGRLYSENTTWLDSYLPTDAYLIPYLYIVDDHTAALHTPINKGHEAMVYLTYILDHYDSPSLPDISIFMHPHQLAWHTPELLNHDAAETLKRLSSERVTREGYMNLRCHWDPGCPERLQPGTSYRDNLKREEIAIAHAWAEMFPGEPVPDSIGAPCCAQFAVSRERIRAIPKASYERYRAWLLRTEETDWISGRVFEYLWHKIFTNQATLCPDARACYCDGYGICFQTPDLFETWFDNHHHWRRATKELEQWEERATIVNSVGNWKKVEQMKLDIPVPGRNIELKQEIDERFRLLVRLRTEALKNGTDPQIRAAVAGRPWEVGNGY